MKKGNGVREDARANGTETRNAEKERSERQESRPKNGSPLSGSSGHLPTASDKRGGALSATPAGDPYYVSDARTYFPVRNVIGGQGEGEVIRVKTGVDRILLVLVLILVCFGSVMVFSASNADAQARYGDSYYFVRRQVVFVALGIAAMLFVSIMPYQVFRALAVPSYVVAWLLLVYVLIKGKVGGGAQRWIGFGSFTFQPSELAKLSIVLMLAWYYTTFCEHTRYKPYRSLSKNPEKRKSDVRMWWRANFLYGFLYPGLLLMAYVGVIALENHLSGLIIVGLIGLVVMFLCGANGFFMTCTIILGGAAAAVYALSKEYTRNRIEWWLHPEQYKMGGAWQSLQGVNAIGSGGLFGLGLGGSRLKYSYVSEPQNDFIFTIVCEELGFIGACCVILLFALFIWRGFVIAMRAPDAYSGIVAFGITSKVAIQLLLNIAVVTMTIPNTGISFPFFSYGGSSLVMQFIEVGVLLSISRYSYQRR